MRRNLTLPPDATLVEEVERDGLNAVALRYDCSPLTIRRHVGNGCRFPRIPSPPRLAVVQPRKIPEKSEEVLRTRVETLDAIGSVIAATWESGVTADYAEIAERFGVSLKVVQAAALDQRLRSKESIDPHYLTAVLKESIETLQRVGSMAEEQDDLSAAIRAAGKVADAVVALVRASATKLPVNEVKSLETLRESSTEELMRLERELREYEETAPGAPYRLVGKPETCPGDAG